MLTRNINIVIICAALTACGGGGGGNGSGSSAESSDKASTMAAVAWTVDDTSTHKFTSTSTAAGASSPYTYFMTEIVTGMQPDGGATKRSVYSDSAYGDLRYDSERRLVSSNHDLGECKTEYLPARRVALPQPVSVGATWEVTSKSKSDCYGSITESQFAGKYTATAQESLTLPIGTFKALKVVSTWTSETTTSASKGERSCWFDPELNLELKCEGSSTRTVKATGTVTSSTSLMELQGYSSANARRRHDSVSRFAGEWSGGYSGPGIPATVCVVNIDTSGGFKGTCGSISVAGTVAADGTMTFKLSEFGQTGPAFTGKFESPLTIKGTFTIPGGSGGTWTLVHM